MIETVQIENEPNGDVRVRVESPDGDSTEATVDRPTWDVLLARHGSVTWSAVNASDLIDALERIREAVDKGETLIRIYCIADNALFHAKVQMRDPRD